VFYIGGEQELAQRNCFCDLTNSGRSSLRLIIESAQLRNKRVLLPNFLCEVIIDVLQEYQVAFDFYKVDKHFQFELPSDLDNFDALYLIKYFGHVSDSFNQSISTFEGSIIVDDVFSPYPHILERQGLWFSFNSLRKISAVADFSLLYSNSPLSAVNKESLDKFASLKYQAKHHKYDYLNWQTGNEQRYLDLFALAEDIMDSHRGIFKPSTASIIEVVDFFARLKNDATTRQANYLLLASLLPELVVDIDSKFYSFAPLLLANRDAVRLRLMKHDVFLAVHWPSVDAVDNALSGSILSVPLDPRYTQDDILQLCGLIKTIGNNGNT